MAKKKHEEHENHERWLVSYADFITLLFAFFVVMYSVSAVNEGKFRTVSESIKAALNPMYAPPVSNTPFAIGDTKPATILPSLQMSREVAIRRLRAVMQSFQNAVQHKFIEVVEQRNGEIVVTIPESVMFQSGEAALLPDALPFLKALAEVLNEMNRHVRVEGHTDNVPIRTAQFPSNWELSATRAVMVVRVLNELYGVPSTHLAALGYADSRPLTPNLTPEQRAKNRRVEIIIMDDAPDSQPPVANGLKAESETDQDVTFREAYTSPEHTAAGSPHEPSVPTP
jgi:chemotaxis protein MotB